MECVHDFLDLLKIRDKEVFRGTYYKTLPDNDGSKFTEGETFSYDEVDPKDKRYTKLLDNLEAFTESKTIKTDDFCGFEINGYVVTQEGELYIIANILKTQGANNTKESLRILNQSVMVEYVLRLIKKDNPWGLK